MEKKNVELLKPIYPNDDRYENIAIKERLYAIPTDRPVRIYCDGIFDMFHYGHARLFEQVKNMFPNVYLIVGVCNDKLTKMYKGAIAMNEKERYESVRHCRHVDEVFEDAPWTLDLQFLMDNRIDYVAHDEAPYPLPDASDCYQFVKDRGMFLPTKRATHISTTKIITGIIKNYDMFVLRQLLRGISHKELNISFLKSEHIRLKNIVNNDLETMKQEFKIAFLFWEELTKRWYNKIKTGNKNVIEKMLSIITKKTIKN